MGYYKNLVIEFMELYPDLEEDSPEFDFRFGLHEALHTVSGTNPEPIVTDFFHDIFPDLGKNGIIWCMASVGSNSYNFCYRDVGNALNGIAALTKQDVNLYFSPAVFTGWRKDKNVKCINTIYIDIDDIADMDFSEMGENDIKSYLTTTYNLTPAMLPDWLVASGHGLHLYYLIDTLNLKNSGDSELRARYTDYLITYFHADIACRNKSRVLRFPTSRNVKDMDNIKTTRLFHLNRSNNKDIRRLDRFKCTQAEVSEYINHCNKEQAEKRKQTMIKNGTYKPKTIKPIKTAEKSNIPAPAKITATEVKKQPDKPKTGTHPELKLNLYPMPSTSRYKRVLRDLHNYAARRKGCPKGYRAIFTHIMAVYLKRVSMPENAAVFYMERYLDDEFLEEAKSIVKNVYTSDTRYMYTNERIAALLNFDTLDLKYAFSAYTATQKQDARAKSVNAYDAKRYSESRTDTQAKRKQRYDYIKSHMDTTAAQLAKELDCSVRTVKSIRSAIRKSKEG